MVDNNVAYGRDNRASSFSDGDPLAELARIVGFDEKPAHVAPAARVATPASAPIRREPEFNLEDELLREFDRYDAPGSQADAVVSSPREGSPYAAPSAPAVLQSVAARGMAFSPSVAAPAAEARHAPVEERYAPVEPEYPPFEDEYVQDDFAELEVDLASELEQAMDMAPSPQPRPEPVPEIVRQPVQNVSPPPRMSLATPVAPHVAAAAAARNDTLSPMEELLYDVERYSLTSRNGEPVAPVLQVPVTTAQVVQPAAERPAVAVPPFSPQVQEAIYGVQQTRPEMRAEQQPLQRVNAPVAAPVPAPARQEPEAPRASSGDFTTDFDDSGFDLALDDMEIDLDLSDIADVEQNDVEEMRTAPASGLHFDPGQIGDTDDVPETIAEVDVPPLPVQEPETRPARRAEDEFDIDSELAVLFNPQKAASGISRQGRAPAPGVAAGASRPVAGEDDDFERALEEDFRRSLNAPIDNSTDAGHSMPPLNPADMYDDDASRRPRWLIPAAVAFVVLAAGGGYALMHSGVISSSSSSNGPVVIAAEKGPLKVVPENPGGKTVPNQDKAVYDRVAGGEPSRPGQETLISTNEQPVDVVQRTLSPENLPLEGEEDEDVLAAGTPVGETEDERLLPRGERTAEQTPDESPVSVSPRKVRTMIVKPDGTLVAQEVPVETAAPVTAAPPQANGALSGLSAPSGEAVPAVVSTTTMPTANTPAAAAIPPANTQVAAVPPAQNATRDTAPVPSSRPSDQPANVVATVTSGGNVVNNSPTTGSTSPAGTAPASTSTPSAGGYYIQVASLPSEAEAQRSYKNLSGKFGQLIAGRGVDIKRADIAGKGTYFRVRIPAGDKAAAVNLCERYRQAGGTCIVAQ